MCLWNEFFRCGPGDHQAEKPDHAVNEKHVYRAERPAIQKPDWNRNNAFD